MTDDLIPSQPTPFKDALDHLGTSGDGLALEAGHDASGRAGASLEASKTLGKGWTASAAVQWAKGVGYAAMGKLKWTPRTK